jgi:hypothetical protein
MAKGLLAHGSATPRRGNLMPITSGTIQQYTGQFGKTDWLEAVSFYSPNQFTITGERSICTLTGYVTWEKLKPAV